jgi:DNA-directed RNA polymerase specialized sigma24 family protein
MAAAPQCDLRPRPMSMVIADRELEAVRRRGFAVAYRMLGTVAEAEDVVQEALLRLTREERRIEEPAAWITTVVTRLSIDVLRLARVRRETYVGPWLPEPLVEDRAPGPGAQVELADSPDGRLSDVLSIDVAGGRVRAVRIVRNPDKLAHL